MAHTPDKVPAGPSTAATLVAEAFGTFLLVLGVVSTALFAAGFGEGTEAANKGVGFVGVSLAVGITVIAGAYAFGPISGGHFNPAVTARARRRRPLPVEATSRPYIIAQIVGGAVATTLVVLIGLFGPDDWLSNAQDGGFASNGWDALSPGGFGIGAAIIVEVLFTALFVIVILGVTHSTRGIELRRPRDRPHAGADPPRDHPDRQRVGEPGPLDRDGDLRRRARTRLSCGCSSCSRSSAP